MLGARPVAVVTGVSSGIGAAIARRLLDEGWAATGLGRSGTMELVGRSITGQRLVVCGGASL